MWSGGSSSSRSGSGSGLAVDGPAPAGRGTNEGVPGTSPPPPPAAAVEIEKAVPTPTLLPEEETEGVTSGAVQPPGSTGETPATDKTAQKDLPPQTTASAPVGGDESEGTSFDDEDDLVEDEDEEDRLIMNGGAGIPIGPVRLFTVSQPFIH